MDVHAGHILEHEIVTKPDTERAPLLFPAVRAYKGSVSRPEQWSRFEPRRGDVIICSPPKCGTTWMQTIVSMLLVGGAVLPERLSTLSPWIDCAFTGDELLSSLNHRPGRRVVKTHTPVDGFPAWEGVTVIAIFRHPLDVFLSLRDHVANLSDRSEHPIGGELNAAFEHFLNGAFDPERVDERNLATLVQHFRATRAGHHPRLKRVHYAELIQNPTVILSSLEALLEVNLAPGILEQLRVATTFDAMKRDAARLAPMSGTAHWRDDAAFFSVGGFRRQDVVLSSEQRDAYRARMAALVPDADERRWLEDGELLPTGHP